MPWSAHLGLLSHRARRIERVFALCTFPRESRRYRGRVSSAFRRLLLQSRFDDRGARLEWRRVRLRTAGGVSTGILFNAPTWLFDQIVPHLEARRAKAVNIKGTVGAKWLYAYRLPDGIDDVLSRFLTLLADVVTVGRAPEPIAHCLALDLYKTPDPTVDPMQWPNTRAGDLVTRSKYRGSPGAFRELHLQMSRVIRDHPRLEAAQSIISIPGRHSRSVGHGELLAQAIAKDVNKPFYPTTALYDVRQAAKEGFQLRPEHVAVSEDVFLEDVIVVDDVFRSGSSMAAVGAKAIGAGAQKVFGLVAAKTLRN